MFVQNTSEITFKICKQFASLKAFIDIHRWTKRKDREQMVI